MRCRIYTPDDAARLTAYLADRPDVVIRPEDRDVVILGLEGENVIATSAACPATIVHHLSTSTAVMAKFHLDRLASFGQGVLAGRGIKKFAYLVKRDNEAMQRFMSSFGAKRAEDVDIYMVNL